MAKATDHVETSEIIVMEPFKQEGFNPYYDERFAYNPDNVKEITGRWVKGEFYPVSKGHKNTEGV